MTLKTRHGTGNIIFSECFFGHVEQLQSSSVFKNITFQCLKQQSSEKITENQQYDVYK